MLNVLLYGLLIWFLYNLVFRFIIPVYKTTRQMKQKFREMQSQMQDQMNQQQANKQTSTLHTENKKEQVGDYIDFEELK